MLTNRESELLDKMILLSSPIKGRKVYKGSVSQLSNLCDIVQSHTSKLLQTLTYKGYIKQIKKSTATEPGSWLVSEKPTNFNSSINDVDKSISQLLQFTFNNSEAIHELGVKIDRLIIAVSALSQPDYSKPVQREQITPSEGYSLDDDPDAFNELGVEK